MTVTLGASWIVVGSTTSDGRVMLLCSREMSGVELTSEMDTMVTSAEMFDPLRYYPTVVRHEIKANVRKYEVITAPDYGTAFERLIRLWGSPT